MTEPNGAPRTERSWLKAHGIRPNKRWGQNFLLDPRIPRLLVERASWEAGSSILEIGPGGGALTSALLAAGHSVRAIEKDPRLVAVLLDRFAGMEDHFHVREGDALKTEWTMGEDTPQSDSPAGDSDEPVLEVAGASAPAAETTSAPSPDPRPWIAGNLPYSITTPLLIRALKRHREFAGIVMMVQREYGERLLSPAGNKTYGSITAWTRSHGDARSLLKVGRSSFWPRPGVESVVLEVKFPDPPRFGGNRDLLERVIRAGFSQRRKKLRNTLAAGLRLEKDRVNELLRSVGIDPEARAETLEWPEFAAFTHALENSSS